MCYDLDSSKPAKNRSLNLKVNKQAELVPLPDFFLSNVKFFFYPSVPMIWLSALQ